MDAAAWVAVGLFVVSVVVGLISWLLANKDAAQEKALAAQAAQIKDLYDKHEADASRLVDLELQLAKNHYPKSEVIELLNNFKSYLNERFNQLEVTMTSIRKDTQ